MSVCCPVDGARDAADAETLGAAARRAEYDHAAREIRPGVAYLQLIAPSMHCGDCVSTLERGLMKTPGVLSARANLTAKRLAVEFDPSATQAADVAERVAGMGYAVHPLEAIEAAEAAEKAETRDLLMRMGIAAFAAMNVMLLAVAVWSGAEDATRDLMHWISAAITAPVLVYCGRPFYVSAWAGLKQGRLNMDAPISLAIIGAYAISLVETINSGPLAFFDAVASLLWLLLLGRWLDRLMRAKARSAAADLARLQPKGATVIGADGPEWRPLAELRVGDRIAVAPGERIAVDGVVAEGASDVDMSHVTGESAPEPVAAGGAVRAGALNLSGALTLTASAIGETSSLGEIQRLMAEAESRKSRISRLADRAAAIYAPAIHVIAAVTMAGWLWSGASWREAAFVAIALLIITCPCALGIAAPMAQATAAGALFRRGIMLKDGAALERLALVDRVVFDKTGTLTQGRPILRPPTRDLAPGTLAAALALAGRSRHPLAAALADWGRAAGIGAASATDAAEQPGEGVSGRIDGVPARLGRASFVGAADGTAAADASAVWFRLGDAAPAPFLFDDRPREGAAATVAALKEAGVTVEALSGDRPGPVAALCKRLGIDAFRAQATPEDKIAHVRRLSDAGAKVLMVGDGVNDAPALAEASVSMAPSSGADVGRAAADLVFFGDDLTAVIEARAIALRTRRIILQNFAISACYNLAALPVAIMGHVTPLLAAILMATSSLIVTVNALRLQTARRAIAPPQAPAAPARLAETPA